LRRRPHADPRPALSVPHDRYRFLPHWRAARCTVPRPSRGVTR